MLRYLDAGLSLIGIESMKQKFFPTNLIFKKDKIIFIASRLFFERRGLFK
jgi:hypothetical protein